MLGTVDHQSELLDADQLCGLLIPEDSIHHKLAVLGNKLFTDADFADLYDSARGRHSVPPSLLAKAMLLQSLEGTSDLDTVDRVRNPRSVLRRLEEDENVRPTEETRPRSRQRNRSSDGLLDDLPKTSVPDSDIEILRGEVTSRRSISPKAVRESSPRSSGRPKLFPTSTSWTRSTSKSSRPGAS